VRPNERRALGGSSNALVKRARAGDCAPSPAEVPRKRSAMAIANNVFHRFPGKQIRISTFLPFRTAFTVIRNQDLIRLPRQLSGFYTNCPYDGS
jgi:hypothetical protein